MKLPLLPTTGVGSFPKPDYVKDPKGKLDDDSRRATRDFINLQERLGIDVLVDGELYRGDMATDYARALGLPIADWTRSYDNRFWKKGIVSKLLARKEPIQLEPYEYAQSLTKKPVKGMLTGPTTLANWNFDNHYEDRKKLVYAWAEVINQEAKDLEKSGARYIQIDEPAIAERHWEKDLFREALEEATSELESYIITHVCYSDFVSVYPHLRHLPVNQVDIELSNELDKGLNDSDLLKMMKSDPLTHYKDVAVGVVDVRPGIKVEDVQTIEKRIHNALEVLAPTDGMMEKIWIKPDCGFRTTKDPNIAQKKMEVMVEAVKQVRESL